MTRKAGGTYRVVQNRVVQNRVVRKWRKLEVAPCASSLRRCCWSSFRCSSTSSTSSSSRSARCPTCHLEEESSTFRCRAVCAKCNQSFYWHWPRFCHLFKFRCMMLREEKKRGEGVLAQPDLSLQPTSARLMSAATQLDIWSCSNTQPTSTSLKKAILSKCPQKVCNKRLLNCFKDLITLLLATFKNLQKTL